MVNSDKLKKLKEDLESKIGFFEYKAERFTELIKKELNNKLSNKISSFIEVHIKHSESDGYLPLVEIHFYDSFINIDSAFHIRGCDYSINIPGDDTLDKAITVGFLANEIKSVGKTYEKITKYLNALSVVSGECVKLSDAIKEETKRLLTEREERKIAVLEEVLKEGSEFILSPSNNIFGKNIAERNYGEGILLTIKEKEKRSYHVVVNGKRLKSRYRYSYTTKETKFKVGLPRLIKTIKECMKDGSNPEFERAMTIAALMD